MSYVKHASFKPVYRLGSSNFAISRISRPVDNIHQLGPHISQPSAGCLVGQPFPIQLARHRCLVLTRRFDEVEESCFRQAPISSAGEKVIEVLEKVVVVVRGLVSMMCKAEPQLRTDVIGLLLLTIAVTNVTIVAAFRQFSHNNTLLITLNISFVDCGVDTIGFDYPVVFTKGPLTFGIGQKDLVIPSKGRPLFRLEVSHAILSRTLPHCLTLAVYYSGFHIAVSCICRHFDSSVINTVYSALHGIWAKVDYSSHSNTVWASLSTGPALRQITGGLDYCYYYTSANHSDLPAFPNYEYRTRYINQVENSPHTDLASNESNQKLPNCESKSDTDQLTLQRAKIRGASSTCCSPLQSAEAVTTVIMTWHYSHHSAIHLFLLTFTPSCSLAEIELCRLSEITESYYLTLNNDNGQEDSPASRAAWHDRGYGRYCAVAVGRKCKEDLILPVLMGYWHVQDLIKQNKEETQYSTRLIVLIKSTAITDRS
ncbi:hypothetical protein J6590_055538 [Homalodisca vitripennis]|nr:hypothetical protein J6590_055538 [Homalodisca vitripennis]